MPHGGGHADGGVRGQAGQGGDDPGGRPGRGAGQGRPPQRRAPAHDDRQHHQAQGRKRPPGPGPGRDPGRERQEPPAEPGAQAEQRRGHGARRSRPAAGRAAGAAGTTARVVRGF